MLKFKGRLFTILPTDYSWQSIKTSKEANFRLVSFLEISEQIGTTIFSRERLSQKFHMSLCKVLTRQFIERQFIERQFIERQFIEQQFIERQFIERQFVERQIFERQFIEPTVYRTDSLSNRQFIEPTVYRTDSLTNWQFIETKAYWIF